MKAAFLTDRGVVKISGDDARNFLNNLVTTEIADVRPGVAKFGALLTPQGKVVVDFLITEAPAGHGGGLLLDCPAALAGPLATKLGFYKLRAKVSIDNLSDNLGVLAIWGGTPAVIPDLAFADPRQGQLGWRILVPGDLAEKLAASLGAEISATGSYEAHRIACSVPRGGVDFLYGDAFPHETNMDRLHGVDFDKGCYIGQEVVSRMEHRGTARTRTVRLTVDGFGPEPGTDILADDRVVGRMGSSAEGYGLATLRIDKVGAAVQTSSSLTAGGVAVRIANANDLAFAKKDVVKF